MDDYEKVKMKRYVDEEMRSFDMDSKKDNLEAILRTVLEIKYMVEKSA